MFIDPFIARGRQFIEQSLSGGAVLRQVSQHLLAIHVPAKVLAGALSNGPAARTGFTADRNRQPRRHALRRRFHFLAAIAVERRFTLVGAGKRNLFRKRFRHGLDSCWTGPKTTSIIP